MQCEAFVAQYGEAAYAFVMNELDPRETCHLLTLCPSKVGNAKVSVFLDILVEHLIMFLLLKVPSSYLRIETSDNMKAAKLIPAERVEKVKKDVSISNDLLVGQDESNALLASDFVLPAQRLVPASVDLLGPKKPGCMLCEYVLHEIVNDLRNVTVKEEIETVSSRSLRKS